MKFLTNSEHLFRNHFQRPYSSNFDPENHYRKPPATLQEASYDVYARMYTGKK